MSASKIIFERGLVGIWWERKFENHEKWHEKNVQAMESLILLQCMHTEINDYLGIYVPLMQAYSFI